MIPPCAIANWLHGLHGEAFEEVGFLVFMFFYSTKSWPLSTVGCSLQVGHQEEHIDQVGTKEARRNLGYILFYDHR